jgi:hypothetical protein
MLRITKSNGVQSIKWFTKEEMDPVYNGTDLDSFVIIPGVTHYQHIYTANNYICFDSEKSYIAVEFGSEADLERYFIQLLREIKLNQITNINFDVDKKSN